MTTLAIIHTTTATVEPLKALAAEVLPAWNVFNLVDDSILPQLACSNGDLQVVQERLIQYARIASDAGADIILEACSSVGEVVPEMAAAVSIPVVRIDEAMAEAAVDRGSCIGVAATLPTTLNPTVRLLLAKASAAGAPVEITPVLAETAYHRLMAGDRDGHDAELESVLLRLAERTDLIVLAQASMARVIPALPEDLRSRFLTSPRMAMERVRTMLEL